ncbi:MAG: peptide chain release factor N(5)-glutamine methyltransferase [Atopobiaceae bacterium]|nr:peptide chain release factor N(5)-glutamine methyltransferase [Atopobiaceae bacterium]MDO4404793.1 HemK/PrmC family methyltransferase [Atopobiaceae bacterium]
MPQDTWTVQRVLDWTVGYLKRKGDERPRLSAEWLLCSATGLTRVELYTNFDRPLTDDELALMHESVARRGRGEPLQYVTGEMPFRHIVMRCEKGVLIPRPETEILVDVALEGVDAALAAGAATDDVRQRMSKRVQKEREAKEAQVAELQEQVQHWDGELPNERAIDELLRAHAELEALHAEVPLGVRVLDLCTGTGCIALSVASERLGTYVVATDLSSQAVSLAQRNRDALNLADAVDIYECDLASAVPQDLAGTFAVLVSNPPYIPTAVLEHDVPPEVRDHEPHLALDGGADGLDVFRRLLEVAPQLLMPGGWLCVELSEDNVHTAAELCRQRGGWTCVEVHDDLTRRPRVLRAVWEG